MRILVALFLFPVVAGAQLASADPQVRSACAAAVTAALPADMAQVPTPKTYPKCDSYGLYDKKDFAAARTCAVQERAALVARIPGSPSAAQAANDQSDPAAAGGLVVLAELYANGEGVVQNPTLAARFLCEAIDTGEVVSDASETKDILATLDRLKGLTATSTHVDFCSMADAMSPARGMPMTRACEEAAEEAHAEMHAGGIQGGIDDAQKTADDADLAIAPVKANLTAVQRAAYGRAEAAMKLFIDVQATGDMIYMGGYGSGGLYPNYYRAVFENQVVEYVQRKPAVPSVVDSAKADDALNEVYRKLMAAAAPEATASYAKITPEKLRKEQRAWIAWRDAMVGLGKTLDAQLPPQAWSFPLTEQRVTDLGTVNDLYGKDWIEDGQKQREWKAQSDASQRSELAQRRAEVSGFFDHQTPAEAAAWERVQGALATFVNAHNAGRPNTPSDFASQQLGGLYGELYAFRYNSEHGFMPTNAAKAQAGFAANDKRLNQAYQADLASPCLTHSLPGDPAEVHRTAEELRAEQRAWLKLRDAWADFVGEFYPQESRAALENMITGGRTFELETLTRNCGEIGGAATIH